MISSSKTGALTYIEPEVNIQLNFELEALMDDERTEIRKILRQLTQQIRHQLPLIRNYQRILTEFDFIQAKARFAMDIDAILPELCDDPIIDLRKAYHPLLLLSNRRNNKKTFPQSLMMDRDQRMLVISGPNAGGKSITMKTVGLLQVMLQCGLLVPVAHGSKMAFFHSVLTDIGDNQSIENQLSTYSYRLKRMKLFLDSANRRSLVLLDEFGTGSDPDLGGALAEVFFEELLWKENFWGDHNALWQHQTQGCTDEACHEWMYVVQYGNARANLSIVNRTTGELFYIRSGANRRHPRRSLKMPKRN